MLLEVDVTRKFPGITCHAAFSLDNKQCGVFGPSGSGKSTLMLMLAGLLEPDSGFIRLNGRTLFDHARKISLSPDRRRVGVVFQHAHLFPHLSVKRNLFYGMNRLPKEERNIDPDHLIEILRIDQLLNRNVTRLSGGERQRVALGRTILANPELILLDEPLSGLDGTLKYQIIPHLRQVFAEFSIPMLFISHSLQELRMMTKEVLVMRQGKLEQHLTTEELARTGFGTGGQGYTNLLHLEDMEDLGKLLRCRWGKVPMMLVKAPDQRPGEFALNGRDIILFKKHPDASSARNMLSCTVRRTYETDWLVGVELECRSCQEKTLIAEIVPQSVDELDIRPGSEVVAVFKASAFRRLY